MDEPILIVDDDVNLNHLLAKFLERNGFLATAAYSAEEAVKTLSTRKFRIVLTDLRLPHKDGLELLQWISGHHPDCQTLLMTSYADVQTAVKAMKLGAADYIAKPIIPDDLLKKLQHQPRRHPFVRHDSAIRQSTMATKKLSLTMGGQQGTQPSPMVSHKGTVMETVRMIIHIIPQEKKSPVTGTTDKSVPFGLAGLVIPPDFPTIVHLSFYE